MNTPKIMLDCSVEKIEQYSVKYGIEFWQLRTPLTSNRISSGIPYGLDNGCFTEFREGTWRRMIGEAREIRPVFVTLPDIVSNARRTIELFSQFKSVTDGLPRALVLQDGIDDTWIPWNDISAVFVGGSDAFKYSKAAIDAVMTAKILGKWVHIGRVNTPARLTAWMPYADSIDGSGISRYDHMLERLINVINGKVSNLELDL